jgi:hypothetical protein
LHSGREENPERGFENGFKPLRRRAKRDRPRQTGGEGSKARINPSLSATNPAKAGFLHSGREENPERGFENGFKPLRRRAKRDRPRQTGGEGRKARINPSLSATNPAKAGFLHSGREENPERRFENGFKPLRRRAKRDRPRQTGGEGSKARINPSLSATNPAKAGFLHSGREENPERGFENGFSRYDGERRETAPGNPGVRAVKPESIPPSPQQTPRKQPLPRLFRQKPWIYRAVSDASQLAGSMIDITNNHLP